MAEQNRKHIPHGGREAQGACVQCRKTYHWRSALPQSDALCPVHKTPLQRCNTRWRFEHVNVMPLAKVRPELIVREVAS